MWCPNIKNRFTFCLKNWIRRCVREQRLQLTQADECEIPLWDTS